MLPSSINIKTIAFTFSTVRTNTSSFCLCYLRFILGSPTPASDFVVKFITSFHQLEYQIEPNIDQSTDKFNVALTELSPVRKEDLLHDVVKVKEMKLL